MRRGEYVPSFGRPEPEPEEDVLEDNGGDGLGQLRVALIPVLDPDAAERVHEQIRLMVAQAVREGFELAMSEVAIEISDEPIGPSETP